MKIGIIGILGALAACPFAIGEPLNVAPQTATMKRLGEMPIAFEPNRGQAPPDVQFLSRGLRHDLLFTGQGARLDVPGRRSGSISSLGIVFVNANTDIRMAGLNTLGYRSSYFIGNDRTKWVNDLPNFSKVRYHQVWNGMDVVFYGNESRLEYDVTVAPGADPKNAVFAFSNAQSVRLNTDGDLVLHFEQGDIVQHKPIAYQTVGNLRKAVPAKYVVAGNHVSFSIGKYDTSQELIIDPILWFSLPRLDSSYLTGTGAATDSSGNSYAAGTTIPVTVSPDPNIRFKTAWVNKIDISGNIVLRFSLAAPDGGMTGNGIAVDSSGNIYVTGMTDSPGSIPGSGLGFQTISGGGTDAYLVRVNSNVTVGYGTYLGGSGSDSSNAVAVDNSGHAFVAGSTTSANFPRTVGGAYSGGFDAFLTRIDTTTTGTASLSYSLLAGGSGDDSAQGVAIDAGGNAYLAGSTASTNFQPTAATGYNTSKTTANTDGFLVKFNGSGSASYFTTYPFGPANAIALDASSNAYLTGETNGSIPTNSVIQGYQLSGGAGHAFVAKFSTSVSGVNSLLYATYLGGSGTDNGTAIATDKNRTAFVTGLTTSANFPVAGGPVEPTYGGGASDAFLSVIDTGTSGTTSLGFSTFVGGSGTDSAGAIALSPYNNPLIVGATASPNFPVPAGKALDPGTDTRAFASKILFEAPPFGVIDTPTNGSTGLSGAINFTGWALSRITVAQVAMCREPVNGEAASTDPHCLLNSSPTGLVYLGNAVFVPGVRPDVAAAFPGYPNNNWGWGAQILTNFLPGTNGSPMGNGTYKLHAIAADPEGLATDLGTRTISVNNAASILPFGTIDTPGQGQTVSGTITNFGWVLTPQPNIVPIDGSTITVRIDGQAFGHPTYNQFRSDIATLFPGFRNSNGAVGYITINTTVLSNGIHNIDWIVTDSAGNMAGLGSRNFFVQN
jgi:hypothetical protein